VTERRYQMTRVRSGDYLLPSNDGRRLWRITAYVEDGSLVEYEPGKVDLASLGAGKPVVGRFWKAAYFRDGVDAAGRLLEWDQWEEWEALLPTRRAAVDAAMRAEPSAAGK
jgi:hypothetical protein